MNRIAEAECATCYVIRPKTEMRPIRVRRKSGSSFGLWRSSASDHTGNSYRASYSHDQAWVCRGCKAPRSDWTPLHYAAAAFVLCIAYLIVTPFLSGGRATSADNRQELVAPNGSDAEAVFNNAESSDSDVVATDSAPNMSSIEAAGAEEDEVKAANAAVDSATIQPGDLDPIDITRARNTALTTGSAATWESNGLSGWVTVSAPVSTGSGVCKTISVQSSRREPIGAVETWCAGPTSTWSEQH